jgi:hypothetical protein
VAIVNFFIYFFKKNCIIPENPKDVSYNLDAIKVAQGEEVDKSIFLKDCLLSYEHVKEMKDNPISIKQFFISQ